MDDNCRPHHANLVEDFLIEEGIVRMEWSACSPDMNPIEHVWDVLGRRVAGHQPPNSSRTGKSSSGRLVKRRSPDIQELIRKYDSFLRQAAEIPHNPTPVSLIAFLPLLIGDIFPKEFGVKYLKLQPCCQLKFISKVKLHSVQSNQAQNILALCRFRLYKTYENAVISRAHGKAAQEFIPYGRGVQLK
ncbi:transposable element Tcb2 transposase [Trichonephila clavipes]|uniref:Transposable element Tcb2 transposase n=1 Tax=Trichonephila clavipes TaxID=2585209 RepID=A0A8X6V8U3_TRICX|nr:transposable element Tcb2 transposase [Trichonephila clavipes]